MCYCPTLRIESRTKSAIWYWCWESEALDWPTPRYWHESGKALCSALPALHEFGGGLSTSAFFEEWETRKPFWKESEHILNIWKHSCPSGGLSTWLNTHHNSWQLVCFMVDQHPLIWMFSDMRNYSRYSVPNQKHSCPFTAVLIWVSSRHARMLRKSILGKQVCFNAAKANPDIPWPCSPWWETDDGQLSIRWTGGDPATPWTYQCSNSDCRYLWSVWFWVPTTRILGDIMFSES